jgi:hypothetical protein
MKKTSKQTKKQINKLYYTKKKKLIFEILKNVEVDLFNLNVFNTKKNIMIGCQLIL